MAKLNDDRVEKPKSEFELNQEAIMSALTNLSTAIKNMDAKADQHREEVIRWVKAGKFNG